MNWRNNRRDIIDLAAMAALLGAFFWLLLTCGCASTVAPEPVRETVASWDGTNQNSGFIGYLVDGRGLITESACRRYNGLIAVYGARFIPPLQADDGIRATGTNTFIIDQQHLQYFMTMQRWRRSGL